jgi:Cof subfamily protein (haloacid dehalogenase superfamily)
VTVPRSDPAGPAARVRLVALDVDGTVLDENLTVAPSTRSAVRDARRRGVRVVLASSRGPVALERVQAALGVRDEWFIGYQGALVARWAGSGLEVLTETPLDPAAARPIEREAEARGLSVGRYAGPHWLVPHVTEAIRREALTTDERPLPSTPEERDAAPPPHKVLVIADGDGQLAALDDLARSLPSTVTGTFSHPRYLEVTAAGVDKAHGLRPLARELGIPVAETAAVGDGANDLGLFRAVGCPIAHGPGRRRGAGRGRVGDGQHRRPRGRARPGPPGSGGRHDARAHRRGRGRRMTA